MKRFLSMLTALALMFSLVPAVFAANTPPYSLTYASGITGIKYKNYSEADDLISENYTVSQRTIEVYDAFDLWMSQSWIWSATVQPFRGAFISAGFDEDISLDNYGEEEYTYTRTDSANNIDLFIIKSQKMAQSVFNDSATILIEHGYMVPLSPQNNSQQPVDPSFPNASRTVTAQQAADALYKLGLFNGTGRDSNGNPNFDLDRTPTRNQAIIMLVRLLGKESEAISGTWNIPFTDVSENMRPYVGYAYTNGLTSGTSATTYGGSQPISANQYISFVLRSLGYISGTDFTVSSATTLSNQLGITHGQYDHTDTFTRGDVAIISNNALDVQFKNGNTTLRTVLTSIVPNNIPASQKEQLLNAYAEKMYYVLFGAVCLEKCENAYNAYDENEVIVHMAMFNQARKNECKALEKMRNLCGNYADTSELKKCVEEDYRLKSMGPQSIYTMDDALELLKIIGSPDYSSAYRTNTDAMKNQLYTMFSEVIVTNTVSEYIQSRTPATGT